ncbi:hypothetical protein CERZMDRAFT_98815 [Cercospora zeae-maydis SCOH1-5]|uniref:Uncharacterized protein n=1 Tax=Cercospora zeae-maydis SCOH1-5 TaxID=717836 RepID=A0A6A6FCG8_9PEZI|nr:hypothetical protein CERZMDRAFT_98815 [Cercospora zeae-maydis SCOH1-5]
MRITDGDMSSRGTNVQQALGQRLRAATGSTSLDCDDSEYLVTHHRRYRRLSQPLGHSTTLEDEHATSEAPSEQLAVVAQVFETYELVEGILLQLSPKDIKNCKRVNPYIRGIIKRSFPLRDRRFGPFPAHHTTLWSKESTGPVKCLPGPISLRDASTRHIMDRHRPRVPHTAIPVALNETIVDIRDHKKFHCDHARKFFPNANMTDDEALSLIIHQRLQYPSCEFAVRLDKAMHGVLDMTFTMPPVSHLEVLVHNPDAPRKWKYNPQLMLNYRPSGYEYYRRVRVQCSEGIRVRHVVAAVREELGERWVKQLWQPGAWYNVLDKKTIVVSKEMMDFVKEKGVVEHPGQHLRRRNYEATYGDRPHTSESD